jgi:hypothetical protein
MIHTKNKDLTSLNYLKAKAIKEFNESNDYLNHIEFLRNNFSYLVDYKAQTGQLHPIFQLIQQDLFDEDPFVVYGASLMATLAFADRNLYH